MSERTVLQTPLGTTVAISASLPEGDVYTSVGYSSTDLIFTEIAEVEDLSEHGGESSVATFANVKTGTIQKYKTTTDYGSLALVLGHMPSDAGQDLLKTASGSRNRYSMKLTYPLGAGESTSEIHYLDVLVRSFKFQDGAVEGIRKVNVICEICREPVVVDAT